MTSKIVPREPVAWLSTVITPTGTKLQRLGFTKDEAEMANAIPRPLYDAAPAMEKPAEDASAADADLVARLRGFPVSALEDDRELREQAADRIAELREERDKLLRERLPYHNEIAFITAERDRLREELDLAKRWGDLP